MMRLSDTSHAASLKKKTPEEGEIAMQGMKKRCVSENGERKTGKREDSLYRIPRAEDFFFVFVFLVIKCNQCTSIGNSIKSAYLFRLLCSPEHI